MEINRSHYLHQFFLDSSNVIHHFLRHFLFFTLHLPLLSLSISCYICLLLSSSCGRRASVTTSSLPVFCHLSSGFYFNHKASCNLSFSSHPSFALSSPSLCLLSLRCTSEAIKRTFRLGLCMCIYSFCVSFTLIASQKPCSVHRHSKDNATLTAHPPKVHHGVCVHACW